MNPYEQERATREARFNAIALHRRRLIYAAATAFGLLTFGGAYGCPHYSVWQQEMSGRASLAKATQDRQITVQEAQAKHEAAKALADAEIERAKGVAEANRIIGDSLKGNESYLRYLWIDSIGGGKSSVIYVPTEAGLPILEAGHRSTVAEGR